MSVFEKFAKALTLNTSTTDRQSWEVGPVGRNWDGWDSLGPLGTVRGDERIELDFEVLVEKAYKESGPIFSLILARQLLFTEARFQWRERRSGKPGELFGNQELGLLEKPWPGGSTSNMLARMEVDASLAGNAYHTTVDDNGVMGNASRGGPNRRMARLRPDWVTIVVGVPWDVQNPQPWHVGARILAYMYEPPAWATGWQADPSGGMAVLLPGEVSHYSPIPDPIARWRGMSWLSPVITEIESDKAATLHKKKFFKHGAAPALSVSFDKDLSVDDFEEFQEKFNKRHGGADQAFKPYFQIGADIRPMSFSLKDLDYKIVQGGGETRLASAARVPPVIAIMSEGLGATSYATYAAAKRHFADGWARPAWRDACASLEPLLVKPSDTAQLWYDDSEIAFLRDDAKDSAEIIQMKAATLNALITAGWKTDAALKFIQSSDWSTLVHSGLLSVQLQAPGTTPGVPAAPGAPKPLDSSSSNGRAPASNGAARGN